MEDCSQVNVTGNIFRRHTPRMHTGVRLVGSKDCLLSGCTIQDEAEEGQATGASLLELENCERINVQGCQMIDGAPYGIDAQTCKEVNITGCTISGDLVSNAEKDRFGSVARARGI